MDEGMVRHLAEAHASAVLAGDVGQATADFVEELRPQVPAIVAQLPQPMTAATVLSVTASGDRAIVCVRYQGIDTITTIELRWKERGGQPQIVSLKVV